MFFYAKVDVPNPTAYTTDLKLYYIDPWLGSIPTCASEYQLALGRTTVGTKWAVGNGCANVVPKKYVYDNKLKFLDKFTGLISPYCPPPPPCSDTSNKGTEFYVAYPANQLAGGQTFNIYLSAKQPAYVIVDLPAPGWPRSFLIPANTVVVTPDIPQSIYHGTSGKYSDAIRITSDVPIVAYAHIWGAASSGATMLMPTCTWGYDYKMLSLHQNWGGGSFASYYMVAKEDNTKIHYESIANPSVVPASADIVLNKGEWYQIIAASGNDDLSGSIAKSVPNSQGKCLPFAFFSGDTRTLNNKPCGGGGDFVMQQNFPGIAWGKEYLTAPTSQSIGWNNYEKNLLRIAIKDVNQKVWVMIQ